MEENLLEPYAVRVARTVLRRGRRGDPPPLSDRTFLTQALDMGEGWSYNQALPRRAGYLAGERGLAVKRRSGVRFTS